MPLISVIMSTYNEEKYIFDSVQSILTQSVSDFEYIIIDDASKDDTANIIESFCDDRIKLYRNITNCGLTKNLNKALSYAKGTYIARMDGDDISHPKRFEKQIDFLTKHQEIALVSCSMMMFGSSKGAIKAITNYDKIKVRLLFNSCLPHPGFMFRRYEFEVQGLRYNEKLKYAQDYDLQVRASKVLRIENMNEVLMKYRVHAKQISTDKRMKQMKCANVTRKLQLSLLDIHLNKKEAEIYLKKVEGASMGPSFTLREIVIIDNILNRIMSKNKIMKQYQDEFLSKEIYDQFMEIYNKKLYSNILTYIYLPFFKAKFNMKARRYVK